MPLSLRKTGRLKGNPEGERWTASKRPMGVEAAAAGLKSQAWRPVTVVPPLYSNDHPADCPRALSERKEVVARLRELTKLPPVKPRRVVWCEVLSYSQ
jgi:hypothetical protein